MNQRQYDRMKADIEADCRRKLEALELVWQMANKNATPNPARSGKGALLAAVRAVVQVTTGEFSARDIQNRIRLNNPSFAAVKRASVSSTLKRLHASQEIERVTEGSGKRGATYKRAAG